MHQKVNKVNSDFMFTLNEHANTQKAHANFANKAINMHTAHEYSHPQ